MGLDMYLSRRVYAGNWDHDKEESRQLAKSIMDILEVPTDDRERYRNAGFYLELPEMYWRKANAIHAWFVREVQDGEDNCGYYYVSEAQLKTLRDLCQDIIDGKQPPDNLPPQEGFFFGSTDIDEWYFKDLKDTIVMIDRTLATKPYGKYGDEFQYHSSW